MTARAAGSGGLIVAVFKSVIMLRRSDASIEDAKNRRASCSVPMASVGFLMTVPTRRRSCLKRALRSVSGWANAILSAGQTD